MSDNELRSDRRIEPEQLASVSSPEDDDTVVDVDGHGIDEEGEMTTEGVEEAVASLVDDE